MIIVDDPISSVDDINKMYILEIIKHIITLNDPQVFILTHVWEDFCNLCYGKQKNDTKNNSNAFFEIKKNETGSFITRVNTRRTPYQHDFKEIYDFSQKNDASDLTECEIYHYPNIMRKILEYFMSFKVIDNSPTNSNFNNVKLALLGDSNNSRYDLEIATLLDVCNILSHKSSKNPDQILKAAKFLMNRIKQVDKSHFVSMTNDK